MSAGKTSDGVSVRFTKNGESLYVILLDAPGNGTVKIESLSAREGSTVQMLGATGDLDWTQEGENLSVTLPTELLGDHAYT